MQVQVQVQVQVAPTWLGRSMRRNWKPDLVMTGELSWDSSVVIRPACGTVVMEGLVVTWRRVRRASWDMPEACPEATM